MKKQHCLPQKTQIRTIYTSWIRIWFDALEPHIDKMTMEIHHDKHHNSYVTKSMQQLKELNMLIMSSMIYSPG